MKHKKPKRKYTELYLLNEDIEKLHERYEQLFKQVQSSLNLSQEQIDKECDILSQKYDFEIEELSALREVDYEIRLAEIEARRRELRPWRRCWLWRLLFKPLTNRAQDIIEERAELDGEIAHNEAENAITNDRVKLLDPSERKREMLEKLQAAIDKADSADFKEAFDEPGETSEKPDITVTSPRGCATSDSQKQTQPPATQAKTKAQDNGQLPGQISLEDVQKQLPTAPERRPRPPRSCRKSAT